MFRFSLTLFFFIIIPIFLIIQSPTNAFDENIRIRLKYKVHIMNGLATDECRQGFTATQRMMILERIFFGWRRNFVLNLQLIFGRKLIFGVIWVSVQTREPSMFFRLELRLIPVALLGTAFAQWERMASILATMISLGLKNMIGSDDRE